MTLKSSGTISASEIGYEYGRLPGQSVSFGYLKGTEPGTTGRFSSYYGTTSAKNLKVYNSPTTVLQVYARVDRIMDWYVNYYDWATRIYNATASGALFEATSLQNTNWPNGLEPLYTPERYTSLEVNYDASTVSNRPSTYVSTNFSLLQFPQPYATSYGDAWSSVVRVDDRPPAGRAQVTFRWRAGAYVTGNPGGFWNPRLWFDRTITGFTEDDTTTWYIPIKKDPDVTITSISFAPVLSPSSGTGGTQALQVVSWDSGGVYVRNRFADGVAYGDQQYSFGVFDVDYRNSGSNIAASWLRCTVTLRYQNYNHNVRTDHWIHWLLGRYLSPVFVSGGGDGA